MNTRSLTRFRRATDERVVALQRRAETTLASLLGSLAVSVTVLVLGLTAWAPAGGRLGQAQSYQHTGSHIYAATSAGVPRDGGGTCSGGCGRPLSVHS
jgi:hypothetical protein